MVRTFIHKTVSNTQPAVFYNYVNVKSEVCIKTLVVLNFGTIGSNNPDFLHEGLPQSEQTHGTNRQDHKITTVFILLE